nr:type II toxin-antitoxin system antitoxin SocA domain-containing protein [uncultured Agathobacter sp.]
MYKALEIAKYIIDKCTRENNPISDLQLQKILYYIQVNFLRQYNAPAFSDAIITNKYGPVVETVYDEYKIYGAMPICLLFDHSKLKFTSDEKKVVDWVIEKCRELNPWDTTVEKSGLESEIDLQIIRKWALQ